VTTLKVNGNTVASADELPPLIRAIVRGLVEVAKNGAASGEGSALTDDVSALSGAVRPEPLVGAKALIVLGVLAALVFWLVRSVI
jgi:hypothetical protein